MMHPVPKHISYLRPRVLLQAFCRHLLQPRTLSRSLFSEMLTRLAWLVDLLFPHSYWAGTIVRG